MSTRSPAINSSLLALILIDIFLTVLCARAGTGLFAPHVEDLLWRLLRWISAAVGRRREHMLSLGGPLVVIAVVAMWFVGLSVGAALVIHPALGSGVKASAGYNVLVQWASAMTGVKEMRHFYPVLCYFRFTDPRYSMARTALITFETTALIRTALDARLGWVQGSAALEQLERSARLLLETLAQETHLPPDGAQTSETAGRWERRFTSALARLRHAGIEVTDDVEAGLAEYVRLRDSWDAPLVRLAGLLGYTSEQIDVSM